MDYDQTDVPYGVGGLQSTSDQSGSSVNAAGAHASEQSGNGGDYEIPTDLLLYNHIKAQQGEPLFPLDHPIIVRGMERVRKVLDTGLNGVIGLGDSLLGGAQTLGVAYAATPVGGAGSGGEFGSVSTSAADKEYTTGGAEDEGGNPGQPGPISGNVPLPQHLQWANDPAMLSNWLANFNAKYPQHPGNASSPVQETFANMQAPLKNFGPPTGTNKDAATYWFKYEGYPEQYALNKVSVESKGQPGAYATGSNAAGLAQVLPRTALEAGFNFYKEIGDDGKEKNLDTHAWKNAMSDPNFASMLGAMIARKSFNEAQGDPYRAEAGYRNGFGALKRAEQAGKPWPHPEYIDQMFPGWRTR